MSALLSVLVLLPGLPVWGAPPDATDPGTHIDITYTYNLGPTGARGWIYSTGNEWMFVPEGLTSESRQILVTAVDEGSPAFGILQANDVILGIGSMLFTGDARKAFAVAIGEAEKTGNGGGLKLKVWRNGVINDNVTITLPVLGAYSDTAPYNCPKSALILSNACNYLASRAINSGYTEGNAVIGLALLAAGRPQDLPKVQSYARSIAAGVGTLTVPLNEMCAWPWGYNNTFLSEYYLATGDTNVLHAISEYTITSSRGQSWCGTYGHGMAWPKPDGSSTHGIVPPYGALNQAGLLVSIGIVLGEKCGITNPEIGPAIERSRRYFAYFAGKGAVPYGESPPEELHDDNGKNGEAALLLALQEQADMSPQVQYFVKSCVASYALREFGHCGPFWAHLWPPLAANLGGTNAMAAYFNQIEWELDLARRWDGSFVSHGPLGGDSDLGPGSATAEFMLTYATALQKIYLTGKNQATNNWIGDGDVNEAIADGVCTLRPDMKTWSTNQLVAALSSWSAQKRAYAAEELVARPGVSALVPGLMTMAEGTDAYLRMGAVKALTLIQDTRALPVLVRRLNDSDYYVRWLAVGGYSDSARFLFKSSARPILTNMLSTIISNELPIEPVNWNEPCQVAQSYLGSAVFNGQLGGSVAGVSTNLLYPAIGAISRGAGRGCLIGFFNGNALQPADVNALAPLLSTTFMAGFDVPDFGVPTSIVNLLSRYYYDEGLSTAMLFDRVVLNRSRLDPNSCFAALRRYRSAAKSTLPELYYWNVNSPPPPVEAGWANGDLLPTIAAIENDRSAPPALLYFKTISSASVTPAIFTNPAATTSLKASASSIAGDPLTYIWSKVRGAGPVTFSPNCTTASSNTTATFTIPGSYVLKLTVADACLGDGTNGYGGVTTNLTVTFKDIGNQVNLPPTANPQSVVMLQDTVQAITLAGTDPEGYELYYSLAGYPANGTLSGTPPNLTYKPATLFGGSDSFAFTVMDSEGQVSAPATVSITVNTYNHPPAALNRSLPVTNNTPAAVLLDGSDVDGDTLAYTVVTQPAHGLLSGAAPNLTFTPAANYDGVDSFTFKVNDGHVDSTNVATVALTMGTVLPGIYSEFFQQPPAVNGWPDMANLLPNDTRIDTQMSITHDYFPANYEDHFSSRHIAYVKIPTKGNYTFTIGADDNTRVFVDEALVIEQFFPNPGSCALQLTPGYHSVRVEFTEGYGDNYFNLSWSGPGVSGVIPASAFFRCVGNPGPLAPTGLAATPGDGRITLSWVGSARVSSYTVKRALVPGGPYMTLGANVTTASYNDSSVTNGTTYYYMVSATGSGGEGFDSTEAYATPVATVTINVNYYGGSTARMNGIYSTNTTASGSANRVAPAIYAGNAWNDFGSANGLNSASLLNSTGASTGVGLTTTTDNGGIWADWSGLGGARMLISGRIAGYLSYQPIFSFTGLNPVHTYDLCIASLHNDYNRPQDFRVGSLEKHVENSPGGDTDWAEGKNYVRFAGLQPSASGTVTVEGKMTSPGSGYMVLNGLQLVDVGVQAPAVPSGLLVSGTTFGGPHVNLSWIAPVGATGYLVKRALAFDGDYTVLASASATAYTDYAVTTGGTYYYKVSATNPTGESGNSTWGVGRVVAPPGVDNGDGAANLSAGTAQLRGNLYSAEPAGVRLYWGAGNGGTTPANWTNTKLLTGLADGSFSGNVSGLLYGLTYYYRCCASNQYGTAWAPATASFTTLPPQPTALPLSKGLALWLDASQLKGLADGQQVNTWTDMSGQHNDALRQSGSSAGYPQYKAFQLNGKPVLRFNSGNGNTGDYLKFSRLATIRTVFWVLEENAGASDGHFLLGDDSSYDFHRASANGPIWDSGYASVNIRNGTTRLMGTAVNGTAAAMPASQFQVISLVTDGNVQANQITQDRTFHGSWQGDIAEILIYTNALSTVDEALVGGFLTAKYGLSTAYPAYTAPAQMGLTNTPATGVANASAVLNATLGCSGAVYSVYACWNTLNGGTNAALWTNSVYVGSWTNVAATNLSLTATGLSPSTPYFFTFRATNAVGTLWATNVQSFTTLAPVVPPPVLPVSGVAVTNGVPSFSFTAAMGCKYRLVYKTALADAAWTPAGWSTNLTGGPLPMTLTDPDAAGKPQRFYRLEAATP